MFNIIILLKLFKLIFMVRFIKILEGISSIEEAATYRSVPMIAKKYTQKINKDCHKVYTSLGSLLNVN